MARAKKKSATRRAQNRKKRTPSVVPKPPPAPLAITARPKRKRTGTVKRATAKAKELAKKPVTGGQIGAAIGGTLGSVGTGALLVGKEWMSPLWASVLMTATGAGATYAAYQHDMPHATAFAAGWTMGGVAQGGVAWIVHWVSDEDEGANKPRNALGDGSEGDMAQRLRLSEARAKELDVELARARERLNAEMDMGV